MLTLRVMDTWSHEQDIRRALGRPGHARGPVVAEVMGYFATLLPYVVGKRAGASEGTVVRFLVDGAAGPITVEVRDGRGRVAPDRGDAPADLTLTLDAVTLAALMNGRMPAAEADVEVDGDADLGQRVLSNLAVMP
jgi:hypothetical protein